MPRLPISEQAMRLALTRPTTLRQSRYVCRACVRQYHASPVFRAELPFWKRLTNSLFGSSEEKAAAEKRDVAHQNRLQELAEQGGGKTETFVDDKGREWTIAAVIDPSINKEYVQAQRWDGLEWVGSKRWIARRSDAGEAYIGFKPRRAIELTAEEWYRVLHHVTVEVLALAQAGRDVNAVYTERAVNEADWKRTARVQVKEKAGAIELQFSTTESMDSILKAMPQSLAEEIVKVAENAETSAKDAGIDVATETVAEESAEDSTKRFVDLKQVDAAEKATMRAIKAAVKKSMLVITDDFLSTPVADPVLKLAILKRVQQLTGRTLRDPVISSAKTMSNIYAGFKIKPEPKKLFDSDQLKKVNVDLPNVTIHAGRQTPIDKHKQVGRWKVIEEELINRGLPVTGSRWQGAKTTSSVL